jgi:hypothetical protein
LVGKKQEKKEKKKKKKNKIPYGKPINRSTTLTKHKSFNIQKSNAARYKNSGYNAMPAHDIEIEVEYIPNGRTPFYVNHYEQLANGEYRLYSTRKLYGEVGTVLNWHPTNYTLDILTEFPLRYDHCGEGNVVITRDGTATLDIYYSRYQYTVSGYAYKYAPDGDRVVETIHIYEKYLYGDTVNLNAMFPNYVLESVELEAASSRGTSRTLYYGSFKVDDSYSIDIHLKPKSGIHYSVNYLLEKIDGTGYEIYKTIDKVGKQDEEINYEDHIDRSYSGLILQETLCDNIVLDGSGENELNLYFKRRKVAVAFRNTLTYELQHREYLYFGEPLPMAPEATDVPGYNFVGWSE